MISLADVHLYLWLNRWARAAAGGAVALLPTPPKARCAARLNVFFVGGWSSYTASLLRGLSFSWTFGVVSVAGAEGGPLEGTGYGGRRRRLWTPVGPFSGSPQPRRPLGEPSVREGGPPPAVRLSWRLAAD
ncbi:unnamed protein product [Pleuronectes platessa]|uniref:Uncharacterized protein n=1 Tax=Pleuronectes platessa TaxID=8262 RepID=A0A9N7YEJ7_PLEPL|nr:unnamed protein product [Pleuronectes platessa]